MDVNVRDYGALGDDVHDDTTAFRNALDAIRATRGTCDVPAGIYKIAGTGITGGNVIPAITEGMNLVGLGNDLNPSVLHVHTPAQNAILYCYGNNFSVKNIQMDMSNLDGPRPPPSFYDKGIPILVDNGAGWVIQDCYIKNTGGWGMVIRGGRSFVLNRNRVLCNNPSAHPVRGGILLSAYGAPSISTIQTDGIITQNSLNGCTLGGHAARTIFRGNTVINNGWGAGIFVPDIRYGNTSNTFINNQCSFGKEGIDDSQNGRFFPTGGFEINSPYSLMFNNRANNNAGAGIVIFGRNAVLAFNSSFDNGTSPAHSAGLAYGIILNSAADSVWKNIVNASRSLLFSNLSTDTRPTGSKTQEYGAYVTQDWTSCISFISNNFYGNKLGEGFYRSCQPNVPVEQGGDLFRSLCDTKQHELLKSLLDASFVRITDQQYILLNQLLTGSSLGRAA